MRMAEPLVLIIDDEKNLINSLVYGLKRHGIRAKGALNGGTGLKLVDSVEPDLVLLDLRLPDISGIDVLNRLKSQSPELPVVMISAHGDTRAAAEAVRAGAEDYFTKPFEFDELVLVIQRTISRVKLAHEVSYRRRKGAGSLDRIIGKSPPIRTLREQIETVARSTARTVLLLGDSGTGKALAARALHSCSPRAGGPFVEVNCASLPESLLEAELFGAEKGAYTDAVSRRVGLARLADGGSLFLDEIGELPLNLQSKILHFLDNYRFRPIGAAREHSADVRVIAATNRDIERDLRDGRFRADLFYRLNVMPLTMPTLTARGEDIQVLANEFAKVCAAEEGSAAITFGDEVCARFMSYPWPGNVRELKNIIERLTILYPGRSISLAQLPPEFHTAEPPCDKPVDEQLASAERDILLRALAETGGRKGKAAEALGISRHALKRRLQRLKIS